MEQVHGLSQTSAGLIPGGDPVPSPKSRTEHTGSYYEELWFVAKTGSRTLIKDDLRKKIQPCLDISSLCKSKAWDGEQVWVLLSSTSVLN